MPQKCYIGRKERKKGKEKTAIFRPSPHWLKKKPLKTKREVQN